MSSWSQDNFAAFCKMRIMSKHPESKLAEYLKFVGLKFHPFDQLEASADSRLISYDIGHEVGERAWKSKDSLLAGKSGSGRTAIAERLLYDCRVGKNSSSIFPICLREGELASDSMQDQVVRAAAAETLLELAYRPWKFEDLEFENKANLVAAIESAAAGIFDQFLPQILKAGSHLPIAEFVDPPARALPRPSNSRIVKEMARQMQKLNQADNLASKSFPSILDIIPGILGLEEVKLIADFSKSPDPKQLGELDRLRDRLSRKIEVSKVILAPVGSGLKGQEAELISWYPDQLIDVLRSRMRVASGGEFDSFNAICDPGISEIEDKIIDETASRGHHTPRAVVSLAKTLLELQAQSGDQLVSRETFARAVKREFD